MASSMIFFNRAVSAKRVRMIHCTNCLLRGSNELSILEQMCIEHRSNVSIDVKAIGWFGADLTLESDCNLNIAHTILSFQSSNFFLNGILKSNSSQFNFDSHSELKIINSPLSYFSNLFIMNGHIEMENSTVYIFDAVHLVQNSSFVLNHAYFSVIALFVNSSKSISCAFASIQGLITVHSSIRVLECNMLGDLVISNASIITFERSLSASFLSGNLKHGGKLNIRLWSPLLHNVIVPILNHSEVVVLDEIEIFFDNQPKAAIEILNIGKYLCVKYKGCNLGEERVHQECSQCRQIGRRMRTLFCRNISRTKWNECMHCLSCGDVQREQFLDVVGRVLGVSCGRVL